MSAETFVARLDRVPLNSFHWKLLITSGLGWMFDAMDVLLIGFLVAPITREFSLAPAQVGLVASAGFVGMFLARRSRAVWPTATVAASSSRGR